MSTNLTTDQVLALAPDSAAAKAGKGLASVRSWVSLGHHAQAVWGECQGSGKEPYRTQVDLNDMVFRCSCPSRKSPCKHGLGLLLVLVSQPAAVSLAEPPPWVVEWLAARAKSAQRGVAQHEQVTREQEDSAAQKRRTDAKAKTAATREAKVAAGVAELGIWLRDQVRQGLATIPARTPAVFDAIAARMVDAQAPGLARMLRELGGISASGAGWQGRILEELAHLYLLTEGYQRLDSFDLQRQADLRTAIGFSRAQEDVLALPGVQDRWLVVGRYAEEQDQLRVQRTWLWGEQSARPALILDFAIGNQPLDKRLVPGTSRVAEVAFFPSSFPLRALLKPPHTAPERLPGLPSATIAASIAAYARMLAAHPWNVRLLFLLGPIVLIPTDDRWLVQDVAGATLPLSQRFTEGWELLAQSGGHPLTIAGEWNGEILLPLGAWTDRFVGFTVRESGDGVPLSVAPTPTQELWETLVASALLGSERQPIPLPAMSGALGETLLQLQRADDPAGTLLGIAATITLYQHAGRLPVLDSSHKPVPLTLSDSRPTCAPLAVHHFTQLLSGFQQAVLPEWLTLMAEHGRRLPDALLPQLLTLGQNEPSLRPAIRSVMGERGRWLAELNPAWAYARTDVAAIAAQPADIRTLWETGSYADRCALLSYVRGSDPAHGRELLMSTWKTEKADERTAFLGIFSTGLSMVDEPFLETVLDDRAEKVRRVAIELLHRLPESRLIQRMIEHLKPLLIWTPSRLSQKPKVQVVLPETHTKALLRDGIVQKPTDTKLGEKAWWLAQMLAVVPPSSWSTAWGVTPTAILGASITREWRRLVIDCWRRAARLHPDQAWIEALIVHAQHNNNGEELGALLPHLPRARQEALIIETLATDPPLGGSHPLLAVLRTWPTQWSIPLTHGVFASLRRCIANTNERDLHSDWHLREALNHFAIRIPPQLLHEATTLLPATLREVAYWGSSLEQFEQLLHLRYAMRQALKEHGQ